MAEQNIEAAYAFVRGHTTGDLRFDEHVRPIKYVTAPNGWLVAPVMIAMLQSVDTVLFIPELREEAMELQVTLHAFKESGEGGALADRWRIHHGDPPDVNRAQFEIDAARFEGEVFDGSALVRENPLIDVEPRLCREVNQARTDELRRLVQSQARITIEAPVMVAVDPYGLDVRARFDIIRVPSSAPMPDAETAERVVREMLTRAETGEDEATSSG